MPTVTIAITSGTRWRVPADCSSATIEIIGAGGIGGGGYSKTNSIALTPLSLVYINIASGAQTLSAGQLGDTWFNKSANSAPTSTSNGCLAKGGNIAYTSSSVPGGQSTGGATPAVGDVKYSGGAGWGNTTGGVADSYGGAAGPNGNGGNGYQGAGKGGGGGANGGGAGQAESGGNGGIGGTNRLGSGGGAAQGGNGSSGGGGGGKVGGGSAGAGSVDPVWTDYLGVTYGPAGGNGSTADAAFFYCCCGSAYIGYPNATNYGGGGLYGSAGLIIVTYTATVSIGTTYTEALNEEGVTNGAVATSYPYEITKRKWRIPYGVENVTVHCIGAGGATSISYAGTPVGGGGAYASSTVAITNAENNTNATYVLATNTFNNGFSAYLGNTWFSKTSNAPTTTAEGASAAYGNPGGPSFAGSIPGAGGSTSNSIGTVKYSGGNGGTSRGTNAKRGGGGGAAGPNGNGANGGNAFNSTANGAGAGGGGANGGLAGNSVTSNTTAVAGGVNRFGTGAGAAGTSTVPAGNGVGGGGGGGGFTTRTGGRGSYEAVWFDSGTSGQYGPGSGGGGHGSTYTGTTNPLPFYGGGAATYTNYTQGADPLLVLEYTMTKEPTGGSVTGNMFLMFN